MFSNIGLVIVDMQKYYLSKESNFYKYSVSKREKVMDYVLERSSSIVIPNIVKLIEFFRENKARIIYLRLCGNDPDRKDLHRYFRYSYLNGLNAGYNDVYPLNNDSMADVVDEIKPLKSDAVFNKTTFSAFTSTSINDYLKEAGIEFLIFTGLATSQCVETTARDASDYGYTIIHIEDAQTDYREIDHKCSLFSSASVCGNWITSTDFLINNFNTFINEIKAIDRV